MRDAVERLSGLPSPSDAVRKFRSLERRFLWILLGGFGLVLILMIGSGTMGLRAMSRIDAEARSVTGRYLRDSQLIDQLVQQQATLGVLIYSLASESGKEGFAHLGSRFAAEESHTRALVAKALTETMESGEQLAWKDVERSAEPLYEEVRALVAQGRNSSAKLPELHERVMDATSRLMDAAYADAAHSRTAQLSLDLGVLQSARSLFLWALSLALAGAGVSVAYSAAKFHRLRGQTATLAELSLHTLEEHEENARRFSKEMHDEFGQLLNAVESSLTVVKAADAESQGRLSDSISLVKDAQSAARDLSQLLRPRILDDFGLDAGLRELARGFSQRTGITVEYRSQVRERLMPHIETHMFRIAQEALTNAYRHSDATSVSLQLERNGESLVLLIQDNGHGFPEEARKGSGLGLLGMRERVRAMGGTLRIESKLGGGVTIRAEAAPESGVAAPVSPGEAVA